MIPAILGGLGCVLLAACAEMLHRRRNLAGEQLRKFLHIGLGLYIACWPWFIERFWIVVLMLGAMVTIMAVYYLKKLTRSLRFIESSRNLRRISYGELFYVEGLAIAALMFHEPEFFSAAVLVVAIADGLAALVGLKYGAGSQYCIRGHKKSVVGSLTFLLTSYVILLVAICYYGRSDALLLSTPVLAGFAAILAAILTVVEAISPKGIDNILLPALTGVLLQLVLNLNF